MIITPDNRYKSTLKEFKKFETTNMSPNIKILWKKGSGVHIFDKYNKKYIDFTSGIFATNIGHNNKYLNDRIRKIIKTGIVHSYHYYNYPRQNYIKKLIKFVNQKKLNRCHLVSSGTEATETALKLIKTYGRTKNKEKTGVICLKGNWHGRTVGSQMLSGKNSQSEWIGYFDKNIYHVDFPYPWDPKLNIKKKSNFFEQSLKKTFKSDFNFKNKISAVLLETFQGWGAIFYPKNYIKEIEKFCKKNNILLCFDEMQSGFGRTGKKFGFEHYDVKPDLICCGKGMGSGFPIAGVITNNKVMDNKYVSGLSSTHSANPVSCEAGAATIDYLNNKKIIKNSKILGLIFHEELKKLNHTYSDLINYTFGKGLIGSMIFKEAYGKDSKTIADLVCQKCLDKGLLVCNTGRESVKLGPPLIIDKKTLLKSLQIIKSALSEISKITKN